MRPFLILFCLLIPISGTFAQIFSSTVNQSIPDNNTVVSFPLVVSGLPAVIDSNFGLESVCLNMTHTWDADMEVILRAPDGVQILLFSGVGGDGDNFQNTCLNDSGPPLDFFSPPFTGTFRSQGHLGNVNNGQNPNGVWELLCRDMAGADQGFLQNWQITFGNDPAIPFIFSSSNLPIIKLTTVSAPIGNDPKVAVDMQVIDNGPGLRNYVNDSVYAFTGRIMAEWQGFSGPTYPKKNFDFEVVDNLGNDLDTTLLGMPSESDWILKAEYLDLSLVKNSLTYEMARRMGGYAPRTKPCEVILDGQYIGFYNLTEKVKRGDFRVDIAKLTETDTAGVELTGGYIFEMNINGDPADWVSMYQPINFMSTNFAVEFKHVYPKSENILLVQHNYLRSYMNNFETVLSGPNYADPVTGYRSLIDVETFIDFLIVNEFSVNYDSYGRSTYLYKEKDTDGGKLKIGPPWDYDRAFDWDDPSRTSGWVWEITHPYWPFPFWWSKFDSDPSFRKQLACRWMMLRQDTLSDAAFVQLIDSSTNHLAEAASRNFTAWSGLTGADYQVMVDSLKSYLNRRLDWMDATLALENVSAPTFYLPTDSVFCYGSVYDASFNGSQFSYNWQPGPDTSVVTWTLPGTYNLLVTDRYGCYARKEINVLISQPDASFSALATANPFTFDFQPANAQASGYAWQFGDGNSSTSVNPSHTYAQPGSYTAQLMLTDSIGCQVSSLQTVTVTGVQVENQQGLSAKLYPVPFSKELYLDLDKPLRSQGRLFLTNELGQIVFSQSFPAGTQSLTIPAEKLISGFYTINLTTSEAVWTAKVRKQ